MPALPPAPQTLKVRFQHGLGLDLATFTHFFIKYTGGPPSNTDLTNFALSCRNQWVTHLAPLISMDSTLDETVVTDLTSSTSAQGFYGASDPGTRVGAPVPASACFLVSLEVFRRYRGGKPRMYWPFGVAGDMSGPQTWSSSFVTTVTTAFNAFIAALVGSTEGTTVLAGVLSNVSYYEGFMNHTGTTGRTRPISTPRSPEALVEPIINTVFRNGIASQRRRLLRLA